MASIAAGSMLALVDPLVIKWLVDQVLPARELRKLALAIAVCFAAAAGRSVLVGIGGRMAFRANQRLMLDLRTEVLLHIGRLSADYHERTATGARQHILRDSVDEVGRFGGDAVPSALRLILQAVFVTGAMFTLNPLLACVILPVFPIFAVVNRYFKRRLRSASDEAQRQSAAVSSRLQEHLGSLVQIQILGQELRCARTCFRSMAGLVRVESKRRTAELEYSIYCTLLISLTLVFVLAAGGYLVTADRLTLGGLIAFHALAGRLIEPLYGLVDLHSKFQRAGAAVRKLAEFLALRPAVQDPPDPIPAPRRVAGELEFDRVVFRYGSERSAIRCVSMRFPAAGRCALVGENGAGKSTVAKLMARVHDPEGGRVLFGGVDIRRYRLRDLRRTVLYMPQNVVLFDDTFEANVRYGDPYARAAMVDRAVTIAELDDVLRRLPRGWKEPLGPQGAMLSGGERQRVAIARAILSSPSVLILDEATGALDAPAERRILSRLDSMFPDTTLVVISHRLASLSWVDRIFVLDRGNLAEQGTHAELYSSGGRFRALVDAQPKQTMSAVGEQS
ncbi:MAG: ABC transporter ATP-binding protein [Bryobacteraceae bacterium]